MTPHEYDTYVKHHCEFRLALILWYSDLKGTQEDFDRASFAKIHKFYCHYKEQEAQQKPFISTVWRGRAKQYEQTHELIVSLWGAQPTAPILRSNQNTKPAPILIKNQNVNPKKQEAPAPKISRQQRRLERKAFLSFCKKAYDAGLAQEFIEEHKWDA